jgi:hypothetical protein
MQHPSSPHIEERPASSTSWTERVDARRSKGPTFRQLYREAKRLGIAGRSHMSKEELEQVIAESAGSSAAHG